MVQVSIRYYHIIPLITSAVLFLFIASCEKEPVTDGPDLPQEVLTLNYWIFDSMHDVYLWEDQMPALSPEKAPDPEKYFYDLLYEKDRYSWIVDDYDDLIAMFDGVELSTGMSAHPGLIGDSQIVYIVEFVTPDSPAEEAGIKRGDIIITIDGKTLDRDNYYDLFQQTTATYGFASWNGAELASNQISVTITAVELNQNPIVHSEVIDYNGYKIGYLVYTQFTAGQDSVWLTALNNVFSEFRSENVTDVIMDLRYNPGGSLDLSAYIASTLGPAEAMNYNKVYTNLVWNQYYNEFWPEYDFDENGVPDGPNSEQLVIRLPYSKLNLDLSRVYFLTTRGTASASESLMAGLYPYTNVIQIGDTTYGKCYGSITIDDDKEPKRHNWAMQPIVLKFSNADGFTDFTDGIIPDFPMKEDLLNAKPFGSFEDPFLAKALEEISGVAPAIKKSTASGDRGTDRFSPLPSEIKPMLERKIEWKREK